MAIENNDTLDHQPKQKKLDQVLADANIEILTLQEGSLDRPTNSADTDENGNPQFFGKKNHLAITKERETELRESGILTTALSDNIAAMTDEKGRIHLYVLSGIAPDENWEWGDKSGPGFFTKAEQGLYKENGIHDEATARQVAARASMQKNSLASPSFNTSDIGSQQEFAVIDQKAMKGKTIQTPLRTKVIEGGYPEKLQQEWDQVKDGLEVIDYCNYPRIIVPNAVAKLLGLSGARSTNQPENFGKTVVGGNICTIELPDGTTTKAFVGGALDSLGIDEDFAKEQGLRIDYEYNVDIQVGERKLKISS